MRRDNGASVSGWAPSVSGNETSASSATVVSSAARWDLNARQSGRAPRVADLITNATTTVVVVIGTSGGDGDTSVGFATPGISGNEGYAVSTVVVSSATRRNSDASVLLSAPGLTRGSTNAVSTLIEIVGACSRDGGASVGGRAPSVTGGKA